MIAEKLLACATPTPLDPRNTLFLAFAKCPAGGAPEAIIGQLYPGYTGIALDGVGGAIVQNAGRAVYAPVPAASLGAGDFLLDIVFDGENIPTVQTNSPSVSTWGGSAYVSTSGLHWDYIIPISPPPGQNHVALGRQSGVVQAWLNGSRVFRAADAAAFTSSISQIYVQQMPQTGADMTVHSVRICYGVDLYGDSANIPAPRPFRPARTSRQPGAVGGRARRPGCDNGWQ